MARSIGAILRELEAVGKSALADHVRQAAVQVLEVEMAQLLGVPVASPQASLSLQGGVSGALAAPVPASDPPAAVPPSRGGKGG